VHAAIPSLPLDLLSLLTPTDPHEPLGQLLRQLCPLLLRECPSSFNCILAAALLDPLQHLVVLLHYLGELRPPLLSHPLIDLFFVPLDLCGTLDVPRLVTHDVPDFAHQGPIGPLDLLRLVLRESLVSRVRL